MSIILPVFWYDCRNFSNLSPWCVPLLYLAAKARRGDALAAELLTSAKVEIRDADEKSYWPQEESEVRP